jgi:hypothetical protein
MRDMERVEKASGCRTLAQTRFVSWLSREGRALRCSLNEEARSS